MRRKQFGERTYKIKSKKLICNKFIQNVHGCPLAFRFLVVVSLFVSLICDWKPGCRPTGGGPGGCPPRSLCQCETPCDALILPCVLVLCVIVRLCPTHVTSASSYPWRRPGNPALVHACEFVPFVSLCQCETPCDAYACDAFLLSKSDLQQVH